MKIAFTALVGSANYNLTTPKSDKDFRVFVYPTLEDVLAGKFYSQSDTSRQEDKDYQDVRKIATLLQKSNPSYLEVLFSREYPFKGNDGGHLLNDLISRRDRIARMNLPYLFNACAGMFNQANNRFLNKIGSDPDKAYKQAASALRISGFISRFYETGFKDFGKAIWYEEGEPERDFILKVKNREMDKTKVKWLLAHNEKTISLLKDIYKNEEVDVEMDRELDDLILDYVKNHLREELS